MGTEPNIIFLSALPVNILPWNKADSFTIFLKKRSLEELKEIIREKEVYCYIRHLPTVNLLRKYFKIIDKGNEQYSFNAQDYIYIFALQIRPEKGADVNIASENDLLILEVNVVKGSWV